ncbi:MAG TPA: G1 family glutamic endopeptidase, partial [Acidimicrobiales bacterium]|nr:G1 family glutamic endopeptidase [Acidimicrobiales bacterium]
MTSPYLYYPLGGARHCPVGWAKRTERARVQRRFVRFVACAIPSVATRRLPILPTPAPLPASSVGISDNWSGYVAAYGGSFSSVSAQWTVPKVRCDGLLPGAEVDTWLGLGGVLADQLFQSGTTTSCARDQRSYAWWTDDAYGYYPRSTISVHPGDVIYSRDW